MKGSSPNLCLFRKTGYLQTFPTHPKSIKMMRKMIRDAAENSNHFINGIPEQKASIQDGNPSFHHRSNDAIYVSKSCFLHTFTA